MIYLHKFLPILVSPLGLVIFLLVTGVVLKHYRIVVAAIILLLGLSLPLTGHAVWYALEFDNPPKKYEEIGHHQAVVVLSGGVQTLQEFIAFSTCSTTLSFHRVCNMLLSKT